MSDDKSEPDTSYDVPDRSTVSPDDLFGDRSGTLACAECEETMPVKSGSSSMECECGHSWRVMCVPAGMMSELEKGR